MQVRKLHLINIKNYVDREFAFNSGVTAICGPNGAGKTTIIEAIAWVLFDHLDYKREDFLRRGARKGSVNVTFISKLDGRDYSVFRDTTGNYYAYDPVLQARIAQQKQDVIKWLCQQHGVEPGTDLSVLFRTTIGVPQGTFTYDFLQAPSKRKPIFDKILKVEDYIKAAEDLKEMVRLIERRISAIREQIASDEGELKHYDDICSEYMRAFELLNALTLQCEEVGLEKRVAEIKVEQLDAAKERLDRLTAQLQQLDITLATKSEREKSLTQELARATRAAELVAATRAGYETHEKAHLQLQELEGERARRDEARARLATAQQRSARLDSDLNHGREAIAQLERDRTELVTLMPRLSEQEALEQQLRELQRKLGEKDQVDRGLAKLSRELDELRAKYSELAREVEEAERHKGAAEQVTRLEQEQRELDERMRRHSLALTEIKHKEEQIAQLEAAVKRDEQERATLDARIANLLGEKRYDGARLSELEKEFRRLTDETAQARAIIERDERMAKEIKGGLCPILSERCLNLKEGETLDNYFNFQLGDYRKRLASGDKALAALTKELDTARAAVSKQATLDALISQLAKLDNDLSLRRDQLKSLRGDFAALGNVAELERAKQTDGARLGKIESELAAARDGQLKYAQLEPRRLRLSELKEEGLEKRKLYETERGRQQVLLQEIATQTELENRLTNLGNPRATIESLNRAIAREPQLRAELGEMLAAQESLQGEMAALERELAEWQSLDSELAHTSALVAQSRGDYDTYISNQDAAAALPSLQPEMESLVREIATVKKEREKLTAEQTAAAANYSTEDHNRARVTLEELIKRAAQLESEKKYTDERVAKLRDQLESLEEVRRRQADKIARRDRLGELEELSEFIRECLRKAGPYITEAYLHTISLEANQLYREISGNSIVSLRWGSDYEVFLEEEGRDRPFNNLSGGEQMAAALSVRLALLKEFSELRFAFFDEPTTNMDEERRRNLAQQIGRIKDFEQLFVVSHDDSFEGFTDQIIQLKKS